MQFLIDAYQQLVSFALQVFQNFQLVFIEFFQSFRILDVPSPLFDEFGSCAFAHVKGCQCQSLDIVSHLNGVVCAGVANSFFDRSHHDRDGQCSGLAGCSEYRFAVPSFIVFEVAHPFWIFANCGRTGRLISQLHTSCGFDFAFHGIAVTRGLNLSLIFYKCSRFLITFLTVCIKLANHACIQRFLFCSGGANCHAARIFFD